MADLVIDASVASAWCFADERTDYTNGVLQAVSASLESFAPRLWAYEIRNSVLMGLRRGTHQQDGRRRVSEFPGRSQHPAHGPGVV
jgi:hypothetical protein